jgi:DNA-binding FadR family transcriptional regulator
MTGDKRASTKKAAKPKYLNGKALRAGANGRKLAEVVANEIEREIMEAGWPVGQVVGSESDLLARFQVSRSVFREAVRIVETHRVARMRRGPNGGLVVTTPDSQSLARSAALVLDFQNVTGPQLAQARMAVELVSVQQAVKQIDEAGIQRLKDTLRMEVEEKNEAEAEGAAVGVLGGIEHDLHVVISELAENPALKLFVDVLISLTSTSHGTTKFRSEVRNEEARLEVAEAVHAAHEGIVNAIIRGDAAQAQHRMRRHLEAMSAWLD